MAEALQIATIWFCHWIDADMLLQVPQLILNYKTGSAEGISLAFLTVWLIGDITNLAGMHPKSRVCRHCTRVTTVCPSIFHYNAQVLRHNLNFPCMVTCRIADNL